MKILTIIIFTILCMQLHAHEDNCDQNPFPELQGMVEISETMEWKAATDFQIKNAHCSRKVPVTEQEMQNWLKSNQTHPLLNEKINGIQFENESKENLESFRYLTSAFDNLGNLNQSKTRSFSSSCKKVDCAVKEIFGSETGTQLLFMHRRFGMNGSHLATEGMSAWRKNELDTVILALTDFPKGMLPTSKNKSLTHAPRGKDSGTTYANATITVFDFWSTQTPEQQRATIFHELSHNIAFQSDIHDQTRWQNLSGWQQTTKSINGELQISATNERPDTIVSDYGQTNSWEDFAESLVAYRYDPEKLKELSPEKYQLIKNAIFDNVEYTSEAACRNPQRSTDQILKAANRLAAQWIPSAHDLKSLSEKCMPMAINQIAEKGTIQLPSMDFYGCHKEGLEAKAQEFLLAEARKHPHADTLLPIINNLKVEFPPEKGLNLISRIRGHQAQTLRTTLLEASKKRLFCDPQSSQYAYQAFQETSLGINGYSYKDKLNKIGRIMCTSLKKHSPEVLVQGMIQN